MKKNIILTFAALAMTAAASMAQPAEPLDTTHVYVVDGKVIKDKDFTGAELVGKTIKQYDILKSTADNNDGKGFCHVLLMHHITTDKAPAEKAKKRPVVFIDGTLSTYDNLNEVKPEDIRSIDVIKDPKMLAAYAAQGISEESLKNGVVRVVTKKLQADNLVYLVDGVQKTAAEVKRISSDKITAVHLVKKGASDKYAKQYGKDVDVVEISTK